MINTELRIVKSKRSHLIVAGKSSLAKCRSLEKAQELLATKRSFFQYWANSASVSIDNADWIEIEI